jgi:predicted DNA-binding transcriptional regulator AlpA
METTPLAPLLRVRDIAQWLGISEKSVYWRVAKGDIPALHIGASLFFDRRQIERLFDQQAVTTGTRRGAK